MNSDPRQTINGEHKREELEKSTTPPVASQLSPGFQILKTFRKKMESDEEHPEDSWGDWDAGGWDR